MVEARARALEIFLPANDLPKFVPGGGMTTDVSSATSTLATGPAGEEFPVTVIAQDEFEALTEQLENLIEHAENLEAEIAYRRTRDEESLPLEMVKRITAGENPVRVWRQHRGLSLRILAGEAGVSYSYLSEIETGKKEPAVKTLKRLTAALDVDLDDLV
jgi:ribosome-binding protein aMBF1 (putative translation factor)